MEICKACLRWFLAGVREDLERTDWYNNPRDSKVLFDYVEAVKCGEYSRKRVSQYLEVFKKLGLPTSHGRDDAL